MSCWTTETEKIINAHKADFDSTNWQAKLKSYGGYTAYLKQLGGVFAKYAGRNAAVKTVAQFQDVAQYVFGLMAIFGFNYNNGSFTVHWAGGSPFYPSADDGRCNWGEIDSLCSDPDKAKTTNCNFGMDSLYYKASLMPEYTEVSDLFRWQGRTYKVVRNKADLKVGDLVHMFGERVTSDDPSTWGDWHHVCCVGERHGSEVIMYDTGSRFISSGNFKIPFEVDSDNEPAGSYSSYHGWAGIHMVDLAGSAKTGWIKDAKGWWYQLSDGSCATGWQKLKWSKGTDWFYFGSSGYMQIGWKKIKWSKGTSWFYFDEVSGAMVTGWRKIKWTGGTHWFFFDKTSGAMQTGWIKDNGYWYYLNPSEGWMYTGWFPYKGKQCYLEPVAGKNQGHAYCNTTATIDGKLYNFDADCYATEISGSGTSVVRPGTKVIDVSEFQPENIDWSKLKAGGYAVIPRIGLRGSIKSSTSRYRKIDYDYHFKKYIEGIISAGIPYSVYYFPTPLSDAEADQEADWIIMNVDGLELSMPLYLDSERVVGGVANDISTEERTRYLKRITDKLVAAGIPCGIYASTSWLQNQINMEQLQQQVQDNTWVAQYKTVCTYDGIYAMWQYSSRASVAGISGHADISEVKRSFNMSCRKDTDKTNSMTEDNVQIFPVTDPVKISNSGSDENGNYKGGKAGDNTGKEWYIRDWYNRPWNCVLRHPDQNVRACLADLAIKAANNNKIGYDQYQRQTYWNELQKVGYNPSKITTACEADCSAGVIANVKAAGHLLGRKELQNITCTYTGNMRSSLKSAGFQCLTASKYLSGSSYLVAGDILLNDAHHTATAVTNGKNSGQSATQGALPSNTGATVRTNEELAVEVILGLYGTGTARQTALGSRYDAVQALVNQWLKDDRSAMITAMARYAIKGYAGNGTDRKSFFGSYYNEVQKEINRLV